MNSSDLKYIDNCPECESWNIRVLGNIITKDNESKLEIKCQDCGAGWLDYVEG